MQTITLRQPNEFQDLISLKRRPRPTLLRLEELNSNIEMQFEIKWDVLADVITDHFDSLVLRCGEGVPPL